MLYIINHTETTVRGIHDNELSHFIGDEVYSWKLIRKKRCLCRWLWQGTHYENTSKWVEIK